MILTKRASRVAALTFGLTFFVTAGIDALGLHECPHHDAVFTAEAATGHEVAGHSVHEGEASAAHGDHHPGDDAPPATGHGEHDGACTCVGSCHLGGGQGHGSLPIRGADTRLETPSGVVVVRTDRQSALLPGAPEFLLPFANAPPGPGSNPS